MEYSIEVQRRFGSPSRYAPFDSSARGLARGEASDRSLNVWVRFQVKLTGSTIAGVSFEAYGCPHFIAAADWMAERIEGRPARGLVEPLAQEARAALEVPTEKLGKLLVLEDALIACIEALQQANDDIEVRSGFNRDD